MRQAEPTTNILYVILYFEIILSLILILPLFNKTKTSFVLWAKKQAWADNVKYVIAICLVLMALSFVGSHLTMTNNLQQFYAHEGHDIGPYHLKRALEAEVNRNLGAACLILTLFLNRYFIILKAYNSLLINHDALQRQARANSASSTAILSGTLENQVKQKSGSSSSPSSSSTTATTTTTSSSTASSKALEEFAAKEAEWKAKTQKMQDSLRESKEQLDKLGKEKAEAVSKAEAAEKQVSAIKKQASNSADEYLRLLKENETLKTKNEDLSMLLSGGKDKHD